MENTNKILRLAFSVIVFCMGMLLMITKAVEYHKLIRTCRERFKPDVIYEQYNTNASKEEIVTYPELIATLFYPLEYDITVGDQIIRKSDHDAARIGSYGIRNTNYRKSYRYNEKGDIIMIHYYVGDEPQL